MNLPLDVSRGARGEIGVAAVVMGVTEELEIGAYFKRLIAFDTLFGGSAHHYRRHADLAARVAARV